MNIEIAATTYRTIRDRIRAQDPQLDEQTLGTVFYDVAKQPGGAGVFFKRTPISRLGKR